MEPADHPAGGHGLPCRALAAGALILAGGGMLVGMHLAQVRLVASPTRRALHGWHEPPARRRPPPACRTSHLAASDLSWRRLAPWAACHGLPVPPAGSSSLAVLQRPETAYLMYTAQAFAALLQGPDTEAVQDVPWSLVRPPQRAVGAADRLVLLTLPLAEGALANETVAWLRHLRGSRDGVYAVLQGDPAAWQAPGAAAALAEAFDAVLLRAPHGGPFAATAHALQLFPDLWQADQLTLSDGAALDHHNAAEIAEVFRRIDAAVGDFVAPDGGLGRLPALAGPAHAPAFFATLKAPALQSLGMQAFWLETIFSLADPAAIFDRYERGLTLGLDRWNLSVAGLS